MKKILVLAVIMLLVAPISAMAGMTAFMDMDEMSDTELAATTGQTGITMNQTITITGGYIAWGDDNGCAGTTANRGWLTLENITASGLIMDGTTIDICKAGGEVTTWLTIGVPALTITAGISAIRVGSNIDAGFSLGELVIHSLQINAMTVEITGHN